MIFVHNPFQILFPMGYTKILSTTPRALQQVLNGKDLPLCHTPGAGRLHSEQNSDCSRLQVSTHKNEYTALRQSNRDPKPSSGNQSWLPGRGQGSKVHSLRGTGGNWLQPFPSLCCGKWNPPRNPATPGGSSRPLSAQEDEQRPTFSCPSNLYPEKFPQWFSK